MDSLCFHLSLPDPEDVPDLPKGDLDGREPHPDGTNRLEFPFDDKEIDDANYYAIYNNGTQSGHRNIPLLKDILLTVGNFQRKLRLWAAVLEAKFAKIGIETAVALAMSMQFNGHRLNAKLNNHELKTLHSTA